MDLLEHPLEAVVFRLYSLPEASAATGAAAWTCLAAVVAAAAAAGLWRLRGASSPTAVTIAAAKRPELEPTPAEEATAAAPSTAAERSPEPAAAASPKERYTAYYPEAAGRVGCCVDDDGDDREDDAEEHLDDDDAYQISSDEATGPFGWEEVVRTLPLSLKPAELGRYRSPTALGGGGSVVQLWDQVAGGGLTPTTASPRRRGLVVATAPPAF